MAYLVKIMPRAERDLEAIYLYNQSHTSPPAARWFNGVVAAIETLTEHPQRNPTISKDSHLRHLLYGKKPHIYRIIYAINMRARKVDILHVRHRARGTFKVTTLLR